MEKNLPKLAIFSGGGALPVEIATSYEAQGGQVHMLALEGAAEPEIENFPHDWVKWGEVGKIFNALETENCRQLLMIGRVSRPQLNQIRLDLGAIKFIPKVLAFLSGGDDSLLRKITRLFEEKGVEVVGVADVAPEFMAPAGTLTMNGPAQHHWKDINKGVAAIHALSPFDVGQALVIARQHIIAVEAVEGTDAMLKRCVGRKQWMKGRAGVLVKLPKTGQEMRLDVPTIGPTTIENVAQAGLEGIVLAEAGALLAEKSELEKVARQHKIFVYGLNAQELETARQFQPIEK